jgi:hypothetical protein
MYLSPPRRIGVFIHKHPSCQYGAPTSQTRHRGCIIAHRKSNQFALRPTNMQNVMNAMLCYDPILTYNRPHLIHSHPLVTMDCPSRYPPPRRLEAVCALQTAPEQPDKTVLCRMISTQIYITFCALAPNGMLALLDADNKRHGDTESEVLTWNTTSILWHCAQAAEVQQNYHF